MPSLLTHLVQQHTNIVNGIRSADVAAAESAVRIHVREVLRVVEPLTQEFPDYFVSRLREGRPEGSPDAG
jgi:DNA-binding GntR family transcriptional regulator